jgi:hypothetical protein
MIVSDERVQKALKYLAETDEPLAQARALMKGLEHRLKTLKAQVYIEAKGHGTDGDRKAMAEVDTRAVSMQCKIEDAFADVETMSAKRKTEELIVEVWRSCNSNRRKGNI